MSASKKGSWDKFRRFFNRHEWAVRLLRLKRNEEANPGFGLVMVQIDGLSLTQFNRALEKDRMPFLKSLLEKEKYVSHSFYSGLPSNTPAVQGELFYGVKTCTPAFNYLDRKTKKIMKMYETSSAEVIEARLQEKNSGLLKGGSSYSNIFTGGAEEAHWCASKTGWGGIWRAINPLVLPFLVIIYLDIFIRTAGLMIIEFVLALYDCVRGTIRGKLFLKEFEFISARVFACVLLRELVVVGACMDIARGLPVIHVNFLGYDEQAHRRGPSSAFAHWCLSGIDDAIRRIWNAAKSAELRDYDVWVYSDHGQEKTSSYAQKNGQSVKEAVQKIAGEKNLQPDFGALDPSSDFYFRRAPSARSKIKPKWKTVDLPEEASVDGVIVTAMGPLGHIYLSKTLDTKEIAVFAERLVTEGKIPLVMVPGSERKVLAWTGEGHFVLPENVEEILGKEHPFLKEMSVDLIDLCHHPDAGNFIIAGWSKGQEPSSFPLENGAHAGFGPEETKGFAFLPMDAPLTPISDEHLRPLDIYHAAREFLMEGDQGYFSHHQKRVKALPKSLRIMTYNVHGCVGMDGKLSTDRIARVIARHNPDVIALQELDLGRTRSGGVDQSEKIARRLEMAYHFHSVYRLKDGHYGNAILSRHPISLIKTGKLPRLRETKDCQPRGAMWVCVDVGGFQVQIMNTHLSLWGSERKIQVQGLLGEHWLKHPDCTGSVVVCGDFNAQHGSYTHQAFKSRMREVASPEADVPFYTWHASRPFRQIDHVFASKDLEVVSTFVPRTHLERIASDHLPLIVDLISKQEQVTKGAADEKQI